MKTKRNIEGKLKAQLNISSKAKEANIAIGPTNDSYDGKRVAQKKYSKYKKKAGLIVSSPVKTSKDPKCLKNFSSGSKLKVGRNSKFLNTDLEVLRSSTKRKDKFTSPTYELVKTKLKEEKLIRKKSYLKDTNCTTEETNNSDPAKLSMRGSHGTLRTTKLKMKQTLCQSIQKKRRVMQVKTLRKSLSPHNLLNKHINISENLGFGVSRKMISLIDDDDKSFVTVDNTHSVNKPKAIQLINDATKRLPTSRGKSNTLKLIDPVKNTVKEEVGEENYEESPCKRINLPQTRSLRTSAEKYNNPIKNFTIVPRLISGTLEVPGISLMNDEFEFTDIRDAQEQDDEDYQLFTWSHEFDSIVEETHPEINQACP
ncbi:unnamed protein product [Moneuplotes crassus]|uniref:Uncharacterized protein n=1 Tax=Euplotes crassus TaxID=5936 RepID=A0AAD1Y5Y1_EUPCR|nr:unnamed protein product [Moneuplotes crassus]